MYFVKNRVDVKDITRKILKFTIEIKIMNLLRLCFDLDRSFFRNMSDTTFEKLSSRRDQNDSREIKVYFMSMSSTKSIHLNDAMMRIISLRKQILFATACSIISVHIRNVKVRVLLDSDAEINCIIKKLIQETLLLICRETIISLIAIIENKACFLDVCDDVKVRLREIVVDQSNHNLILKRFFVRAVRMQSININNNLLKISIHSDDDTKKIFFSAVLAHHFRNKDVESIFLNEDSLN